jgi:ABC-type nitrate/sulfonate/bicarbonate transport system permease component
VISEMFAARNGVGYAVKQFQNSFDIPQMWSGVLMLGLFGVLLAGAFALVRRWVLGWYLGVRRAERGGR